MLTHFHSDHLCGRGALKDGPNGYKAGGLTELGDLIPFGTYVDRGWPDYNYPSAAYFSKVVSTMPEYRQFIEWHHAHGMKVEQFNVGTDKQFVLRKSPGKYRTFSIRNIVGNGRVWTGRGTSTKVMNTVDNPEDFDENMFSCGFVLRYGDFSYYNCGDLGGGTWGFKSKIDRRQQDFVADVAGKITVMKPDHHGWKDCMSGKLLMATRPDVYVEMGSQWQHPYVESLRRMMDPILLSGQRLHYLGVFPQTAGRSRLAADLPQHRTHRRPRLSRRQDLSGIYSRPLRQGLPRQIRHSCPDHRVCKITRTDYENQKIEPSLYLTLCLYGHHREGYECLVYK